MRIDIHTLQALAKVGVTTLTVEVDDPKGLRDELAMTPGVWAGKFAEQVSVRNQTLGPVVVRYISGVVYTNDITLFVVGRPVTRPLETMLGGEA